MDKEQEPVSDQGGTPEQPNPQAAGDEVKEPGPARQGDSPGRAWKRRVGDRLRPLLERKRMLVAASAVVLVLAGLAFYRGSEGTGGHDRKLAHVSREQALQDGLRQEELPRFYVPLPQSSQNRVAVVDFFVVWDALSAVRFKKMESQVRDRLYSFMLGLAAKGEDLQDKASALEAEMGRIFRDALRTENLAVSIREIRSY